MIFAIFRGRVRLLLVAAAGGWLDTNLEQVSWVGCHTNLVPKRVCFR